MFGKFAKDLNAILYQVCLTLTLFLSHSFFKFTENDASEKEFSKYLREFTKAAIDDWSTWFRKERTVVLLLN